MRFVVAFVSGMAGLLLFVSTIAQGREGGERSVVYLPVILRAVRAGMAFPVSVSLRGKVVFTRCDNEPPRALGPCDLYAVNPDGSGLTQVTNTPQVSERGPSVSPDGSMVLFNCGWEICLMNADGSGRRSLPVRGRDPAWSPDGKRVALVGSDGLLYVMNPDGTGMRRLTAQPGGTPAWSPDSTRIAFTCWPEGNVAICVVGADAAGERVLFDTPGADAGPVWSPDGRSIAIFQGSSLLLIDPDGRDIGFGFANGYFGQGHAWSPDGTTIVFATSVDPRSVTQLSGVGLWVVTDVTSAAVGRRERQYLPLLMPEGSEWLVEPVWVR